MTLEEHLRDFVNAVPLGINYAVSETRILDEAQKRKSYSFQYQALAEELLTKKEIEKLQECRTFGFGLYVFEVLGFNLGVLLSRPHRVSDLRNSDVFRDHPLIFPPTSHPKVTEKIYQNGVIERDIEANRGISDDEEWEDPIAIKEYIINGIVYQNTRVLGNALCIQTFGSLGEKIIYHHGDNYFIELPDGKIVQQSKEEFDKVISELKI